MLDKKLFSPVVVLALVCIFFSCKKINPENNTNQQVSNPESVSQTNNRTFDFLPTSTTSAIVVHDFYTLSYNEKYEQAEWVAYELKSDQISHNHFQRPFFVEDDKVKTHSADWRNYKKSGYDKGHLCAAGDMCFSKKAHDDTFFTSNISPQVHDFNDGVWNRLEQKVRYWAGKYDGIYVVTGGVLNDNLPTIGRENVAVPEYFYKVLLDNRNGNYKMIAFIVPSQDSDKPLYDFVVSVDEVEKLTGIDFYPNLPDEIENKLEKMSDYKDWSF
jgi:endonuclease G, mitochondrial